MHSRNPIRRLARRTPSPLDGIVEYGAGFLDDLTEIVKGLPDDPIDAWNPEHIRRTLPWLRAINAAYFRPDVRGLENIPVGEPSLLAGTDAAGRRLTSSPDRTARRFLLRPQQHAILLTTQQRL